MKTKINEGDSHGKDTDFFTSLQNLAKEIKSCGKRGASIKLKKALEEETREIAAKEGKRQKSKSDTITTSSAGDKKTKRKTNHEAPCSEPAPKKSKSQTTKDLKLKEMMAFAGISLQTTDSNMDCESSDAESSSKTIVQATSDVQTRSSPQKTPSKSSGASSKTIVQVASDVQTRNSPKKNPSKSSGASSKTIVQVTSDVQARNSPKKTPSKSSGASSKTIVQVASDVQTRNSPKKTPSKSSGASSKTIVQVASDVQTRNSPKKPPSKSSGSSSKTIVQVASDVQTRNSPKKTPSKSSEASSKTIVQVASDVQTRDSPKKTTSKSSGASSKTIVQATSEVQTRSSPRKKKASSETTSNLNVISKATNELQTRSSPRKTTTFTETSTRNASALFDFATTSATSSLVSSSLNLLNAEIADDLESTDVAYNNTEEFGHFSHSYYEPEYGYNSDMVQSETSGQQSPIQNITGYYQRLDSTQQGTILGFLNILSSELHKITYGQPPSSTNDPCSSNTTTLSATPILSAASSTDENERKVPLIMDTDSLFKDVLVNPSKLRNAESAALMAKNPPAFLLNKILDLVFHPDELKFSKGVKGLNTHKMEAINEYLFAWCLKMNMDNVTAKTRTTIIQNKIGNLRFKGQKKTKLVMSK